MALALEMRGISKRFPGTLAVDGVDFAVCRSEVHALMGENGAGKSTLMNILAGSFADYTGEVFVNDQPVTLHTPAQAKAAGIGMIHQELSLAGPLSIAENILAGSLPKRGVWLDRKCLLDDARAALARVGLALDPRQPVETLSQHEAQLVEIAKAITNEPSILVMDEPTSSLSRSEVEKLFAIIRQLKAEGLSIVYISHHLPEVFEVADRVTVMRDGRKIETQDVSAIRPSRLVELMVGRSIAETRIRRETQPGATRLAVRGFCRYGFFHDVSFQIRQGEVLGLAGLAGSGRSEIARSLSGIDPVDEGEILLNGETFEPATLRAAMKRGLGYLTEDRKLQGLALNLTASKNALAALNARSRRQVSRGKGRELFQRLATTLQLQPSEPRRLVNQFSGGNQQKLLLAKWLAIEPDVLILDEPTRGVDVGAKQVIHEAIGRLADAGKSILLITSDLPEMVCLANRVVVLRKGHIIRELTGTQITEDQILLAANGENG